MKKRAQGLSMKVIVLAVLALLVLVVIITIFSAQIGKVSKGFTEARESSNLCREDYFSKQYCTDDDECPEGFTNTSGKCPNSGELCCNEKLTRS